MEIGWDQAKDVTEIFEAMGFSGRRTVGIWLETTGWYVPGRRSEDYV